MPKLAENRIVAAIVTIRADPKLPIRKVAFNFALNRETSRRRLQDPETRKESHVSQ